MSNSKKVRESLSKKISKVYDGSDFTQKTLTREQLDPHRKVEGMISGKITDYFAKTGLYTGKYAACKYLGLPISELMSKEKALAKDLEKKTEEFKTFKEDLLAAYKAEAIKVGGMNEARAEEYAAHTFEVNVKFIGYDEAYASDRQKYLEMDQELTTLRAEVNAIAVAKADYMEQNAELIRSVQEQKAREDLEKSGLLQELGLRPVPEQEGNEEE